MTAKPENPPATDSTRALELLRLGTPGPWTIGGINGIGQIAVKASDGARIALVDEQWLASAATNARRIAANPELIEVCAAAKAALEKTYVALGVVPDGGMPGTPTVVLEYEHAVALWDAIAKVCKGVLNNG